jgi:hypothetical protein
MATTADIEAAIDSLRAAEAPNISQIAKEYGIERTRLSRLYRRVLRTKQQYDDERRFLNKEQDKKLVAFVKRLSEDGLPPTAKQVRHFAKELTGILPGKN